MRSQDVPMARSRLTVARDHLAPDDAQIMLEVFGCLQEATTEIVGELADNLVAITVLAHLVRVTPDSASTDVDVVEVSSILVHHQRELEGDNTGSAGSRI